MSKVSPGVPHGTILDEGFIVQYKYGLQKPRHRNSGYAVRQGVRKGKKTMIGLHHDVWVYFNGPIPDRMYIDHVNRNGLDNRLANLRLATASENRMNMDKFRTYGNRKPYSRYKGVFLEKSSGHWRAIIQCGGIRYNLGTFKTEIEAAKAYDKKAESLSPRYKLNFGGKT